MIADIKPIALPQTLTRSPLPSHGRYIAPVIPDVGRWLRVSASDADVKRLYRRQLADLPKLDGCVPQTAFGTTDTLILMSHQADALMVFRPARTNAFHREHGIHCVLFRNEGHFRCPSLIHEAVEEWAWRHWPGERLFTFTSGCRVGPTNPGYCFRQAGWRRCGATTIGMIILEKLPDSA